jgi:hypothetical protein
MRVLCATTLILLLCAEVAAKPHPKTRNYAASCDKLWVAAKLAVKEQYDVLSLNDQDKTGAFQTGNAWTGVRALAFSLSGTGNSCTVSVTGHFSGAIHNDKGDFFERVQKHLTDSEDTQTAK